MVVANETVILTTSPSIHYLTGSIGPNQFFNYENRGIKIYYVRIRIAEAGSIFAQQSARVLIRASPSPDVEVLKVTALGIDADLGKIYSAYINTCVTLPAGSGLVWDAPWTDARMFIVFDYLS